MPIYTYTCADCGQEIDVMSSMKDRNESKRAPHQTPEGKDCDGELQRGETVETAGATPFAWRP